MITHVVLFRMADGSSPAELVDRLRALPGLVPEIDRYEAGVDVVGGSTSFDVGLVSTFASRTDLETYRDHPAHQDLVEWLGTHTTERAVVDFESG